MKYGKIISRALLTGIVLAAVSAVLLLTLDLGFLRGMLEARVSEAAGRAFSIERELSIRVGRELSVSASGVRLANPEWAEGEDMLRIGQLNAMIDLRSLLRGIPLIRRVEVDGVALKLQHSEDGRANWELPNASGPGGKPAQMPVLIETMSVSDARIEYTSPRLDAPLTANIQSVRQQLDSDDAVAIDLDGSLGGERVRLSGLIGPRAQLLGGKNIVLRGEGQFGRIAVRGRAEFDDLLNPRRPVVDLRINGPEFAELTRMLGIEGLGEGDLNFSAATSVEDGELNVSVSGNFGEFVADIDGRLPSAGDFSAASIRARISGPNFGRVARLVGEEGWPHDAFEIDASWRRDGKALQIERFGLSLAGAKFELSGTIPDFPSVPGTELALHLSGPHLAPFRDVTGIDNLPDGRFLLAGSLQSRDEESTAVDLRFELPQAEGTVTGTLSKTEKLIGSDLALLASGPDAALIGKVLGIPGLPAGKWILDGGFARSNSAYHDLNDVNFITEGLVLQIDGRVGAESLDRETDVAFSMQGQRMSDFQQLAGELMNLPDLSFSISGRATALADTWKLTGISANTGTTHFSFNGLLGKGESLAGTDIALAANGVDLGKMFNLPGQARMPDGPFTLSAALALDGKRISISEAALEAGTFDFEFDADLPWPPDLTSGGFRLLTRGVNIRRVLPELAGMTLDGLDYELHAKGNWQNGRIELSQGKARIGEATLVAQGVLDLPPNLSATDFRIEFQAPDLSRLGTIDGARWGTLPLHLTSSFDGTTTKFLMESFDARLGDSRVEGDVSIDFGPETPAFDIRFTTDTLNLKPFQVDPREDSDGSNQDIAGDGRIIPDLEFPMDALALANGHFALLADRVLLRRVTLLNSALTGTIRNGELRVEELATDGFSGRLQSTLSLVPEAEGSARLRTTVNSKNLILNLTGQAEENKAELPPFNIDISLESSGRGLRESVKALNGHVRFNSPGGKVSNVSGESASALLLAELISAISPSEGKKELINVSCVAANFGVNNGVVLLDPGLAVQSDRLNIFAGGKVDLDTEKISVNFRTQTRKTVDLSASELFSPYVKLSGTLASPSVALDPRGTLLSGGAAYLSGGLSILAKKALDQIAGSKDPCADFLEQAEGRD